MLIYWMLFAFPALMAIFYPNAAGRQNLTPGQMIGLGGFLVFHFLVSALRWETGGDWVTYDLMLDFARANELIDVLDFTDPGFGLLLWACDRAGLGILMVNGFCSWVLGWGVVRASLTTRDPWLGITISVPYLLIVVGMGYVRQGAAIGFILMALASLANRQLLRMFVYLAAAASFHSTAAVLYPLFGFALASRNRAASIVMGLVGAYAFYAVISGRIDEFQRGYLDYEYSSGGALVRQLMNFLPSILLLWRWRRLEVERRTKLVWICIALINVAQLGVLAVTPSSTAVDRIGLYFSVILICFMGELRDMFGGLRSSALILRTIAITTGIAVQLVWLVLGTHAEFWVPYKWVFDYL